jgi:hypothetical protein
MTSPWPAPEPSTVASAPTKPPPFFTPPRAIAIIAGVVLLIAGVIGFAMLAAGGEDERPDAAVASTTVEPDRSTAPATEPENESAVTATTAPEAAVTTTAAPSTTVPATSAPAATAPTVPASPATVPAAPPTTAGPTVPTGAQRAVAVAQRFGDALAAGRWDEARALNPGRGESDAFLQQEYGPLVRTTVVPVAVQDVGGDHFDLRLGLVAHEEQPSGRQSVLMCAHWNVDVAANTVTRLSFNRLRVEPGFVDPATRAAELRATCAR